MRPYSAKVKYDATERRTYQNKTGILFGIRHEPLDKVKQIDAAITVIRLVRNIGLSSPCLGGILKTFLVLRLILEIL